MKIVINTCFGGFNLSEAGTRAYYKRKGKEVFIVGTGIMKTCFDAPMPEEFQLPKGSHFMSREYPHYEAYNKWFGEHYLSERDIDRNDPDLVAVVEELGPVADGRFARLDIVEIPDDAEWQIAEYDGTEHVAEKHRTWR